MAATRRPGSGPGPVADLAVGDFDPLQVHAWPWLMCGERHGPVFQCTRESGHELPHVAGDPQGIAVVIWEPRRSSLPGLLGWALTSP